MQDNIQKLQFLLPKFKPYDAKFAGNLIAAYHKYGKLTSNQMFWVDKLIERAGKIEESKKKATPVDVGNFVGVTELFKTAKLKLKYPKIHLTVAVKKGFVEGIEQHEVILSLNGPNSKSPGWVNVSGEGIYPQKKWYGRISPTGFWFQGHTPPEMLEAFTTLFTKLGKDPVGVAQKCAILSGMCCFCNSTLTDPQSTSVGFGKTCAKHYGLETQWKTAVLKSEEVSGNSLSLAKKLIQESMKLKTDIAGALKVPGHMLYGTATDWKVPITLDEDYENATFSASMEKAEKKVMEQLVEIEGKQVCEKVEVEHPKPRQLYQKWQEEEVNIDMVGEGMDV